MISKLNGTNLSSNYINFKNLKNNMPVNFKSNLLNLKNSTQHSFNIPKIVFGAILAAGMLFGFAKKVNAQDNKTKETNREYSMPKGYRNAKYIVVQEDNNLWNIAKQDLEQKQDTNITDEKIYHRMIELAKINNLSYSKDFKIMVNKGDTIYLEERTDNIKDFFE